MKASGKKIGKMVKANTRTLMEATISEHSKMVIEMDMEYSTMGKTNMCKEIGSMVKYRDTAI